MSETYTDKVVNIKVIGVGGAGNNVVNRMITSGIGGVEFVVVNTDRQDLNKSKCDNKLQIGEKLTGGMGAGSKPDIGKKSAEESRAAISKCLEGADMVFITAGMGGGTGTGAAPIIADLAHEAGILTVGVVTKPFKFEGANRMKQAEAGIAALSDKVDSLIIIPNDRLKYVTDQKITFANAFGIADDVLKQAVTSISELVGYSDRVIINLDFADVSSIMKNAGRAHMGVGIASGREKAEQAAMAAVAAVDGMVPDEAIRAFARTFGGVEHRIELIRTRKGVRWYNDSIASSPSRTIAGLNSFPEQVILIAGGKDKGISYAPLGPVVNDHVKLLLLCGKTAGVIREAVEQAENYHGLEILDVADYHEAVAIADARSQPGDVVILSPASTSFDRFANFMERGQVFKAIVNELK